MSMKPAFALLALSLAACAGRSANPVPLTMATDVSLDCHGIQSQLRANAATATELEIERNWKLTQNVAAGGVGIFFPPAWLALDFKGGAKTDAAALEARQKYLRDMSARKGCGGSTQWGATTAQRGNQ
jgi:hypothetical protein